MTAVANAIARELLAARAKSKPLLAYTALPHGLTVDEAYDISAEVLKLRRAAGEQRGCIEDVDWLIQDLWLRGFFLRGFSSEIGRVLSRLGVYPCTRMVSVPSTTRLVPEMKLARGLARNTTASAISSGRAMRPSGLAATLASKLFGSLIRTRSQKPPSNSVVPGETTLARMPFAATWRASDFT